MLPTLLKTIGAYRFYEKWLEDQVKSGEMPRHLGIMLDGNLGVSRTHASRPVKKMTRARTAQGLSFLKWSLGLGIRTVTMFLLSAEAFKLHREDMGEHLAAVEREASSILQDPSIHEHQIRVKAIGRLELLPESLTAILFALDEVTANYGKHFLNLGVGYDGRIEIVDATRRIIEQIGRGSLEVEGISEGTLTTFLYASHLPNPYPDLIIRASGEARLVGFPVWQTAYSEFIFLDVYWPEFRRIDLLRAIRTYQLRKRKFGK